jgi:hypothetical protein
MWGPLIIAVLQFLAPLLLDWLKKWLDGRFKSAAAAMPPADTYPDEHAARNALFDEVLARLPRHAKLRRKLVERARGACVTAGVTSAGPERVLPAEERAELAALSRDAGEE